MGKSRDYRGPRRRAFDDDVFPMADMPSMRPAYPPGGGFNRDLGADSGPVVDATVKWFNPEKGFGFAELADGSGDVFLHIGVLQASGRETVAAGAKLKANVGQGAKGRQITKVVEVDESAAAAAPRRPPPRGPAGGGRPPRSMPDPSTAVELAGLVKWFNAEKGFGFVIGDDGGKDVFVHISILERARLATLNEGQRVLMRVVETPKGREAISLSLEG
jgi:cold shock protein